MGSFNSTPEEANGGGPDEVDVLIVGGGPVGPKILSIIPIEDLTTCRPRYGYPISKKPTPFPPNTNHRKGNKELAGQLWPRNYPFPTVF